MSTATSKPTGIDTLTVSDDLHKAGFPQPQAKALAHWASQFVTKADLRRVQSHLARKIDDVDQSLGKRIGDVDAKVNGVEQSLGKRIDDVKDDLGKRIDGVEQSLGKRIDDVKDDLGKRIDGVEQSLNKRMDRLDHDLSKRMDRLEDNHKELRTTIAWNLGITIAVITLAATLAVGVTLWGMDKLLDRALSAATATIEAPVTESASLIEPSGHEHDENRELSTPH